MRFPHQKGFSLLEVLISVLIFSIGLLGVAALLVLSVRTNHSAYLRTQASFLAESMADRIRTNLGWINEYTGDYDASTAGEFDCGGPCTPKLLIERDRAQWSQQLIDQLPNARAKIDCDDVSPQPGYFGIQPYSGLCRMTITWTEADLSNEDEDPAEQTFAWVFQP